MFILWIDKKGIQRCFGSHEGGSQFRFRGDNEGTEFLSKSENSQLFEKANVCEKVHFLWHWIRKSRGSYEREGAF